MNTSINEVSALARKAARGAGYSWSLADEAAFATGWLCRNGVDGASVLANHLKISNRLGTTSLQLKSLDWPWAGSSNGLCALFAGTAFSDIAASIETEHFDLRQVIGASLLLPYVAYVSQTLQNIPGSLMTSGCTSHIRCEHFDAILVATPTKSWLSQLNHHGSDARGAAADVTIEFNPQIKPPFDNQPTLNHRTLIPADALTTLNQFAEYTYAPATDASRQGAGAGETDND